MSGNGMLHIKPILNPEQRRSLLEHLVNRLHIAGDVHASGKPHLLFVPVAPARASPRRILAAVRECGYDARLVDL